MRKTRRGVGKHDQFLIESDESLTLKPLDGRQRSLVNDHDHDLDSVSPPSTSQSRPRRNPGPAGDSVSVLTPSRRRSRKWARRNGLGGGRTRKESEPGCSSSADAEAALETGVGSLRIDERVDEQSESGERVREESEAGTSKDSNSKEFNVTERLEELCFGVKEPELSEEQIGINSQAQEDELLVMESIYGDNVLKFDRQNGLQYFQVHIDIEAPNGIAVTAKLDSSSDDKTTGSKTTEDFSYSFEVQYLPPIVLTCLLPESYPSHRPPYFTLSVQWLDPIKASSLCSMLDSIWEEQSGQEIIYQWVEWLSSSSLSYLGFEKEIILGPYGTRRIEDRRAISGCVSPDVDIPVIKRHNDERLHENFRLNSHECCICFSEYPGSEFVRLPCHHFFCWKCMKTFSNMHVNEGTVIKLQCPEAKCGGTVPPSLLKRLLSQEEYERWESLTLQKTLESMSDVVYCPRCETPCIEEEDQHAQCTSCFFSFCTLCRDRRHVGVECLDAEKKLTILQERQNSSQLNEEQRGKEHEMINELLSIRTILLDAKQCPSCNMAISKIEGCNKMVCDNCGKFFCYLCNKKIRGYDHYSNGNCVLYPREMLQQWDELMNRELILAHDRGEQAIAQDRVEQVLAQDPGEQVLAQDRDELIAELGLGEICPTCGQFNVKVGNNNNLFCWACQIHYCYLCRKIARLGTDHFGPKGCKQHTAY